MYKIPKYSKSKIKSVEKFEGEPIEHKIERIISNNESITDGAPEVYTERKDGVVAGYNIRTDRWEIACEAMDKIVKSKDAQRANTGKVIELKAEKKENKSENGETESTQGTE